MAITDEEAARLPRTPDGYINNCSRANGESAVYCQMCGGGPCPDAASDNERIEPRKATGFVALPTGRMMSKAEPGKGSQAHKALMAAIDHLWNQGDDAARDPAWLDGYAEAVQCLQAFADDVEGGEYPELFREG